MSGGGLIDRHRPSAVTGWSHQLSEDPDEHLFLFNFPSLTFQLRISSDYQQLVSCEVWDTAGSIRRRVLDPVRRDARSIFHSLYHNKPCRLKELDVQVAVLQVLERLSEHEDEQQKATAAKYVKGWAADDISDWNDIINNPYGLDASTIQDTASDLVGMTPEEIVKDIPSSWRVIHMESIMRGDLLGRFRRYQNHLRAALAEQQPGLRGKLSPHSQLQGRFRGGLSHEEVVQDMLKPRLTFHGTPLKFVRSIIRNGFLRPGRFVDGRRIESPRSGIAFDRGIYSSQSAAYAMSYAKGQRETTPLGTLPSMRLFVCATLMARTYVPKMGPDSVHGPLVDGFDSHFDGAFEYIVYEESAMLPCYVIHLDLGSDEAQRAVMAAQLDPHSFHAEFAASRQKNKTHPRLLQRNGPAPSPGDVKREQLAKKAAAMKWFPYGFGSASGTQFVIEEIGEVSEDDEEYGEWQADKHAYIPRDGLDKQDEEQDEEVYSSWDEEEGKYVTKTKKKQAGLFLDKYQGARQSDVKTSVGIR